MKLVKTLYGWLVEPNVDQESVHLSVTLTFRACWLFIIWCISIFVVIMLTVRAWLEAKSKAKRTFAKGACNNMKFHLKADAHWRGWRWKTKQTFHTLSDNSAEKHPYLMLHHREKKKSKLVPKVARLSSAYTFPCLCVYGELVDCFRTSVAHVNHLFSRLLDLLASLSACNPTCSVGCYPSDNLSPHPYTLNNTPCHLQPLPRVKRIFMACC